MAQLTINIPDTIKDRVLDGLAYYWGYLDEVGGLPNPETKISFVKKNVVKYLKNVCKEYEIRQAQNTSGDSAAQKADNEITLS